MVASGANARGRLDCCDIAQNKWPGVLVQNGADPLISSCKYVRRPRFPFPFTLWFWRVRAMPHSNPSTSLWCWRARATSPLLGFGTGAPLRHSLPRPSVAPLPISLPSSFFFPPYRRARRSNLLPFNSLSFAAASASMAARASARPFSAPAPRGGWRVQASGETHGRWPAWLFDAGLSRR